MTDEMKAGRGGGSRGDGRTPGFGRGSGSGVARRWEVRFIEGNTLQTYARQLDFFEIELGVLSRQCLDRRMDAIEIVGKECSAWDRQRNEQQKGVDWRFATADARIKLKRLYPQIKM